MEKSVGSSSTEIPFSYTTLIPLQKLLTETMTERKTARNFGVGHFFRFLHEVFDFGFEGDRVGSWAASFMYQARAGPYC